MGKSFRRVVRNLVLLSLLMMVAPQAPSALLSFGTAGPTRGPDVVKTVFENLPEKVNFKTVGADSRIFAFKYGPDHDIATDEDYASAGAVYVFDPNSATWQPRKNMPVKKVTYSLVALNNRIYAIGGFTAKDTPTDSIEEYDPVTDTWTLKERMPTARCRVGTAVLDGKIFALGGRVKDAMTDVVEVFDPAANTWTVKKPLPRKLMGVTAEVVSGRLFLLKGVSFTEGRWDYVFDFREYDQAADTWKPRAQWSFEREPIDLIVTNGRLFAAGGGAFTGPGVHSMKEYDLRSDQWVFRKDMPEASAHTIHPSCVVLGGKIYIFGGGNRKDNAWEASAYVQRYDPDTDTWEELPPLSEPKIGMGVTALGDRIFVFGGEKMGASGNSRDNPFSNKVEIYEVKDEAK